MSSTSSDEKGSNTSSSFIPSELRLSQKWDRAIETFLIRGTAGFVVAGLSSVVLFRTIKIPKFIFALFD